MSATPRDRFNYLSALEGDAFVALVAGLEDPDLEYAWRRAFEAAYGFDPYVQMLIDLRERLVRKARWDALVGDASDDCQLGKSR